MPSRILAHVDMNAFFASVEALRHPEWKSDPIVVCVFSGRTPDSGVVSSASYDARALGVHAGMPIISAKQKCPHGHFVPVDPAHYHSISESVFVRLFACADAVEIASIDEAYAELTLKSAGSWSQAESQLRNFQSCLKKETGLSCSIGLAPNKLLAKMASDIQKPMGFTIVYPEDVSSFLDPLSVKAILGVGSKTEEELAARGLHVIRDVRLHSRAELISFFGAARGSLLFNGSRGIDESPLEPERDRKQHSKIWTLVQDAFTWNEIQDLVHAHSDELWSETVGKGQFFTQLGVIGISSKLTQATKSKTLFVPCASRAQFADEIQSLFADLFASGELPLRRVGIRVSGFSSAPKQKRLGDF